MQAGKLRTLLKLQQPGSGRDSLGQPVMTWTDVADVRADVRFPSGLEGIRADADTSVAKASVRIRFRAGVTAAMRLTQGARVYNIQAVLPDARRQWIDLPCEVING